MKLTLATKLEFFPHVCLNFLTYFESLNLTTRLKTVFHILLLFDSIPFLSISGGRGAGLGA